MTPTVDLVADVERCSRAEARRLLPSVTVEPIDDGAFLYRRGKQHVNWRVVVDGQVADPTGALVHDRSRNAARHEQIMAHLWRYADHGITPDLLRSVVAMVRETPVRSVRMGPWMLEVMAEYEA